MLSNQKRILSMGLGLLLTITLWAQPYWPGSNKELVKHSYYALSYDEVHEQAEWVYYELTPKMIQGSVARTNDFRPDPKVSTQSAQLSDYKGSGFDRGHLCPAGSMKLNHTAMSESFYLSNMSPQQPSFNRGAWKKLEEQVRSWALKEGLIYVVTGPVFTNNQGAIGPNSVTIPGYYFKVIYAPTSQKMIAFVMPNAKINQDIKSYAVHVDHVEQLTGLDFFPQLDDALEAQLESTLDLGNWQFGAASYTKSNGASSSSVSAAQCQGMAKSSGQQCKNKTTNKNAYCSVHQSQAPGYVKPASTGYVGRCCATTKAGTQCKRNASGGTRYCWQHQ